MKRAAKKTPSVAAELHYQKRKDVVEAVQRGQEPKTVAEVFGVALSTVYDWLARYRQGGWHALRDGKRSGRPRKVDGKTMKWLYDAVTMRNPNQYQFRFCLWTLKIIRDLLKKKFGISISCSSVSRLMAQLGLSPQRPLFKAAQQDPDAVDRYLRKEYPEIRKRARRIGAEIFFVDEAAFRSDHHSGTTWAPVGETPVIPEHRGRFGCKAISAVSARGKMYFQCFKGRMDRYGFIAFLKKLRKDVGRPIIVVADRASYHLSKDVRDFVGSTEGEIGLEYLPTRSPELNPSEQVWNRAKERLGRVIIRNAQDMKSSLYRVLRGIQSSRLVVSFFKLPDTRYATV